MRPLSRRRLLKLALLIAGLACGFAASAGADLPPLPTVTLPTVTLPTVTLPTVPPPPPAPPVPPLPPPPVQVPPPPHLPPPPPAATPSLPAGLPSGRAGGAGGNAGSGGMGGSTGAGSTGGRNSGGAASAREARSPQVYRLHLVRDWIAKRGSKRQRHTTIVFVLRNPSLVRFMVVRVSPDCRRVAHFRVVGREGVNRVRLGPRVGRHALRPGTYRLVARAVPGGRKVVDARLVVARRANRSEIEAARGADTCTSAAEAAGVFSAAPGGTTGGGASSTNGRTGSTGSEATGSAGSKPARHQGVLGAHFARKAVRAASHVPLWLYALLALAIVLLAAAALPLRAAPSTGTASVLARHRGVLALAGAGTLVAVMVAYVLL